MSAAPMRKGEVINEDSACLEDADPDEEELRAISSCSLRCFSLLQPGEKILQGPGAGPGPRRYLVRLVPKMVRGALLAYSLALYVHEGIA